MNKVTLLFSLLWFSPICYAQRGKTGNLVVSSQEIVNEYTTLTANANAGNTFLTVANSNLNTNGRFGGNLASGDLVMIIQMQGATLNGYHNPFDSLWGLPPDSTWGAITNYNNCGEYEFAEVSTVPNGTTINLDCPLANSYTSKGRVQVIRVPRYNTLTVNNGGSIGCDPWNGSTGGVTAIEVLGNTVINSGGDIDVSNNGFRGALEDNDSSTYGVGNTATQQMSFGVPKGESIGGYNQDYNPYGGRYCKGAPANGGGGGDAHNGGGGGGANGGVPAKWVNGFGVPDISQGNYVLAWNKEYSWMSAFIGSGGGRGGYTFSSASLDPTTNGPNNAAWAGDDRNANGGWGGRPLDYSTGRLFTGGGGGGGDQDDNYGGGGGNGGGMVYLMSYGTVSGLGQVIANGQVGFNAQGTPSNAGYAGQDGAGGGGAGGTIVVNSVGNISGITLTANGGNGGSQVFSKGKFFFGTISEAEGPGGGGGGGYIATSNIGVTEAAAGGVNGTTNSPTMTKFPPNGATKGGVGTTGAAITNFQIVALNDTICSGQQATLNANLTGKVPAGTGIEWYTAQTGGASIGSGPSYTTPILVNTTTYYVGTCPGTYRQAVTVVVNPLPVITISAPDTICTGQNTILTASGGTGYSWAPAASLNNPNIASPTATPLVTTTYTVSVTTPCGTRMDSVKITVKPAPKVILSGADTICEGNSTTIKANGGSTYSWSTGATTGSVTLTPITTTTYTVQVGNGSCTTDTTVTITVNPVPIASVSGKDTLCAGASTTLTASGGTNYNWNTGATTDTINVTPASTTSYTVTVSNDACSTDTTITVTVYPNPVPSISEGDTVCAGTSVQLNASGGANYSWSPFSGLSSSNIPNPIATPPSTTQYTVTVANGGCAATDSVKIVVNPLPLGKATGTTTITSGSSTPLVVTPGPGYTYKWIPSAGLDCDTCLDPQASPKVTTVYYVIITDSAGCSTTDSVTITVESNCGQVFVPNAFSPNGDQQNDVLYVKGDCIQSMELDIYDRWGNKVFESEKENIGWDGQYAGKPMNAGTYVYVFKAILTDGTMVDKKGDISLVR